MHRSEKQRIVSGDVTVDTKVDLNIWAASVWRIPGRGTVAVGRRIAHFVQRYPPALGGSEAYFARLSRHLSAAGDHVTVFTTDALDLEAFWYRRGRRLPATTEMIDGVEVRRYPLWTWPLRRYVLKPISMLPYAPLARLALPCNPIAPRLWTVAGRSTDRFDLVHAGAFPYAWPIACGLRLARRQGIPFFLTPFLHTGDPDDPHDRTRRAYLQPPLLSLLREADRIFTQTTVERDVLLGCGIPSERVVVQGMGVDPADCTGGQRERARQAWSIGADDVVIGHLANKSVEKGTVDLLKAAELLWQDGRQFRLVLAGAEMANFRAFWSKFPLAIQVIRLDVLSDAEKRDFFAGLDFFALPSRSDSFGLVLLEAWANGLATVGYRAGGVAGVIRHEVDGLLVKCGDVAALATALGRLLDDATWRRQLGAEGQQRVRQEFRWERSLEVVCQRLP
jgi:glycosyltransferase involved in cell wall biosynthesis